MKASEIRNMDSETLEKQQRELRDQLFKLRFQAATNQNENPGRIRIARKDLARVKTVLNQRKRADSKAGSQSSGTAGSKG